MDINNYINSGILELYVYGALSAEESAEVTRILKQYPEVLKEVEEIEKSLMSLSAAVAPQNPEYLISSIKEKLSQRNKVYPIARKSNWPAYIGWAASVLLLVGLFYMFNKNNELRESLQAMQADQVRLESEIAGATDDAQKTRELLSVLRDRNILKIPLPGQEIAPEAYATAYWDQETNTTYIDARDLPTPPPGMVYQVWSLELQPLTPTSIGLLEDFEEDQNKIFALENVNASQAFGITLEPAGGSDSPTMEQLYALGVIAS
ncbi:MAG TPA: anti-sigma factor [Gillisia sp.]|nr:anti-sigma factor [Gillisia sp.]